MTPKEKARDIANRMYYVHSKIDSDMAKKCALIAVEEILDLNVNWLDETLVKNYPKSYKEDQTIQYWEQVKSEIEKL